MSETSLLNEYFSREQLAAELGVHVKTLEVWDRFGKGPPATRFARKVLYRREGVTAWLQSRERQSLKHAVA
jgi:predicted site-specific integrase-resolvase